MNDTVYGGHSNRFADTHRNDRWWVEPFITGVGFLCFVVYTTWAMFQGNHYYYGSYLSPFFSPLLYVDTSVLGSAPIEHAWIGVWPSWWPSFIPTSPALFILALPLSFRMTCYYYRKFYYRSFFLTPPACGVNPIQQKNYKGETSLLSIQNIHRYALYFAIFYIIVLYYDAYLSFFRHGEFGIGVGSIILLINPTLLGCYTFGCHAFRHLIGGKEDCFSCTAAIEKNTVSYSTWKKVSWLNSKHMLWAWLSMIWVGFTDFYIRMCSQGVFTDYNTWNF